MTRAQEHGIQIKGTRRGLAITLGQGEWQELLQELDERLTLADTFFRDSQVYLIAGKRRITQEQMQELLSTLENHSVKLISIRASSEATARVAQASGVRLALPKVRWAPSETGGLVDQWLGDGVLMRRTLRSGQSLRHPGHVVIIGDVNPGAEVIAGGDIVVWGKLRGVVHAGAMGNDQAVVCALHLAPPQLRIGSHIARSPDDKVGHRIRPETASVVDGQIVAQAWDSRQKGKS